MYSIIGTIGASIDMFLFFALVYSFEVHYLIANIVSTTIGLTHNFLLNAKYNFKVTDRLWKRFGFFYAVGCLGVVISSLTLVLCIHIINLSTPVSKFISMIIAVFLQYSLNKSFSFRKDRPEGKTGANINSICYFGMIRMNFSRNKVFSDGLKKNGVHIIECISTKTRFAKLIDLYTQHKKIRGMYDAIIAGYPGYTAAPFARLISRKKVILDALASRYDSEIISRNHHKGNYFKKMWILFIDWMAFVSAHLILVESFAQKEFVAKKFRISKNKIVVAYTGVNEEIFKKDPLIEKHQKFTVMFRGRIMNEAGVQTILKAADILKNEDVYFDIIGYGWGPWVQECHELYQRLDHGKVQWDEKELPFEEMVQRMQKAHISLGQFATSERVDRTIPHKAYESMILSIPYITARSTAVGEILEDGKECIMINPEDPEALAEAIVNLRNSEAKRSALALSAQEKYWQYYSVEKIGSKLKKDIEAGLNNI